MALSSGNDANSGEDGPMRPPISPHWLWLVLLFIIMSGALR